MRIVLGENGLYAAARRGNLLPWYMLIFEDLRGYIGDEVPPTREALEGTLEEVYAQRKRIIEQVKLGVFSKNEDRREVDATRQDEARIQR
jgi:hypothetical protein